MNNNSTTRFPPGHFYSPIVNPDEVKDYVRTSVSMKTTKGIPGIVIDAEKMNAFWRNHVEPWSDRPFPHEKTDGRYFSHNNSFGPGDALVLRSFMGAAKPRRIIEIGSGFSTACMLDAAEQCDLSSLNILCIEPFPDRLKARLRQSDYRRVEILERRVQDCDLSLFAHLTANDVLFIDSTHVLKTGSDVHYEITQILPSLAPGVLIHFHDIQFPFEYPGGWIFKENFSWNEIYAVHIFLMFNDRFNIEFFTNYFGKAHTATVARKFSELARFPESLGGSLWLRKCC